MLALLDPSRQHLAEYARYLVAIEHEAEAVNERFAGNGWRSNFLCNIGYGDWSGVFNRSPRLEFDEACLLA